MIVASQQYTSERDAARPLPGLMMDFPLTVQLVMRRMSSVFGSKKVVSLVDPETGACEERDFRDVVARAGQLANALQRLGVRPGDRVASLAWNNIEHLEIYLAVMCMGAVLHTMNLRLHGDQLAYTVNHAGDRVVIVERSLASQFAEIEAQLSTVEHVIVIGDASQQGAELPAAQDYEKLIATENSDFAWPDFDERSAASLCYTSGTTGDPKGVLYSHRAIILHALSMSGGDAFGLTSRDRVMLLVPLFHAMGWGLPFVAGLVGSDLVMPGQHVRPSAIAKLIEEQQVTWSSGVPTLWFDLLHHIDLRSADNDTVDLSTLHTILCGGTAVPETLIDAYADRFQVAIIRGWGMTEILPGATVGRDDPRDGEATRRERRKTGGRISPLYELRVMGAAGAALPHDGASVGEIEVRGPIVTCAYFENEAATAECINGGWLRTGDVGTIDVGGDLRITDRAKDVIKSGGEWISSQDLESALISHPGVREAAVIGIPDARFGERPLAFIILSTPTTVEELRQFLAGKVARWWVPEQFAFVEEILRTSTGKYDKKVLRNSIDLSADMSV